MSDLKEFDMQFEGVEFSMPVYGALVLFLFFLILLPRLLITWFLMWIVRPTFLALAIFVALPIAFLRAIFFILFKRQG